MSDAVWLGLFGFLGLLVKEYFDYRRSSRMSEKIQEVHLATNSMKDALVAATEKEALARGAKDERDRAEKGKP